MTDGLPATQSDHDSIVSLLTEIRYLRKDIESVKRDTEKLVMLEPRVMALEESIANAQVNRRTMLGLIIAVTAAIIIVIGDIIVHLVG